MHGEAYAQSARVASAMGPFAGYSRNAEPMLRVIDKHRKHAHMIDAAKVPRGVMQAALDVWDEAYALGVQHGFRNAQVTCIAPTGTIALVMDCDTTGVEPDFALVKFKKLAGGGYFKIINASIPPALERLGYSKKQIGDIVRYCVGVGSLDGCPHVNRTSLKAKGFSEELLTKIDKQLASAFDLAFVFNRWTIGDDVLTGTAGPDVIVGDLFGLAQFGDGRRNSNAGLRGRSIEAVQVSE